MQRQNGRNVGQTTLFGGLTDLAAVFTLVAGIERFRVGETFEGGRHVGQRSVVGRYRGRIARGGSDPGGFGRRASRCTGRRCIALITVSPRRWRLHDNFQADVFNGIERGTGNVAKLARDGGLYGSPKE